MTFGVPGIVDPYTFTPGATNCIWYQIEGNDKVKCGSFASIGNPETVLFPETAQLLEPILGSFSGVFIALPRPIKSLGLSGIGTGLKSLGVPTGIIGLSTKG